MGADDTKIREVRTEFTARDAGLGATLTRLGNLYETGNKKLESLTGRFSEFRQETGLNTAAMLGVGLGLGAWIVKAKEAQAEFNNTQTSLAGVLSGALQFDKGTGELEKYNRALVLSKGITSQLDEVSTRFIRPLSEVSGTYQTLVAASGRYGLSQKQVMGLTEGSMALAKRFGVSGEQSAMAIARALETGTVRGFGPFDIALRASLGNMKKLNAAQRFEHVERALKGSTQIADAMSGGMNGALARIQSTTNDLVRDLSTPLFAEIAKTIEGWAKSLHEMTANGKPLIDEYANKLVGAFRELKDLSQFIREHWVAIAGLAVMIKGGGALGSAGSFLSGLGKGGRAPGPMADLASGAGALGGLFETVSKVAPALTGIAGAAWLASTALKGMYDEWQVRKKSAGELGGFFDEVGKAARAQRDIQKMNARLSPAQIDEGQAFAREHAAAAAEILRQKGLLDESGAVDRERFNQIMDSMADDVRAKFAENFKGMLGDVSSSSLGAFAIDQFARNYQLERAAAVDDSNRPLAKNINNFYGGIHVSMKVEEADPDRVFVRFEDGLHDMVDKRSQAIGAEPQGM